jgi:hypothetical protein
MFLAGINVHNFLGLARFLLQKRFENLLFERALPQSQLYNFLNDIMKTGKTIYKKDPVKVKEYTQTEILSRLEHTISEGKDKNNGGTTNKA